MADPAITLTTHTTPPLPPRRTVFRSGDRVMEDPIHVRTVMQNQREFPKPPPMMIGEVIDTTHVTSDLVPIQFVQIQWGTQTNDASTTYCRGSYTTLDPSWQTTKEVLPLLCVGDVQMNNVGGRRKSIRSSFKANWQNRFVGLVQTGMMLSRKKGGTVCEVILAPELLSVQRVGSQHTSKLNLIQITLANRVIEFQCEDELSSHMWLKRMQSVMIYSPALYHPGRIKRGSWNCCNQSQGVSAAGCAIVLSTTESGAPLGRNLPWDDEIPGFSHTPRQVVYERRGRHARHTLSFNDNAFDEPDAFYERGQDIRSEAPRRMNTTGQFRTTQPHAHEYRGATEMGAGDEGARATRTPEEYGIYDTTREETALYAVPDLTWVRSGTSQRSITTDPGYTELRRPQAEEPLPPTPSNFQYARILGVSSHYRMNALDDDDDNAITNGNTNTNANNNRPPNPYTNVNTVIIDDIYDEVTAIADVTPTYVPMTRFSHNPTLRPNASNNTVYDFESGYGNVVPPPPELEVQPPLPLRRLHLRELRQPLVCRHDATALTPTTPHNVTHIASENIVFTVPLTFTTSSSPSSSPSSPSPLSSSSSSLERWEVFVDHFEEDPTRIYKAMVHISVSSCQPIGVAESCKRLLLQECRILVRNGSKQ